jgi:glutamate 5-kinase
MRDLPPVRTLVVKVGSSSLTTAGGRLSQARLAKVARDLVQVRPGRHVALVSSGAIASGWPVLGGRQRPKDMPGLQAAAAIGQGRLLSEYARAFAAHRLSVGQVLLTQDDFLRRHHFVNARNTIERLFRAGVVPVVNENDTVATEEIRFGDNDRLAALVAVMIGADLLVLLSDVGGIYTHDPRRGGARLLRTLDGSEGVSATGPHRGSGGMASKLEAARIASAAGVPVVVAGAAATRVLERILGGAEVGTYVAPRGRRVRGKKSWIGFAVGAAGRVVVDAGAERALVQRGASLLPRGVIGVEGSFGVDDAVDVADRSGRAFARGISSYSAEDLRTLVARRGAPYDGASVSERPVIHRDELVVMEPWET